MSYEWFKLYHDLPDDIKLRRFTPEEKWAWVCLLCLASQETPRGIINKDNDDIADYCGFSSQQEWLLFRGKLVAKKMVETTSIGALKIIHWDERQHINENDRGWTYRRHQRFVFERDKFSCVYCGRQDSLTLDHVIPQCKGGSHERTNLVTCCSTCNSSKGAKTLEEWLGGNT